MKLGKETKRTIGWGILVWFLCTVFLEPLRALMWRAIVAGSAWIYGGYLDRICRNAALADPQYVSREVHFTVFTILFFGLFFFIILIREREGSRPLLRMSIPMRLAFVFLVFGSFFKYTVAETTSLMGASFNQRLTVLAPSLSDADYKAFRARWCGIRGKGDYDSLLVDIEARAKQFEITLPPPPDAVKL